MLKRLLESCAMGGLLVCALVSLTFGQNRKSQQNVVINEIMQDPVAVSDTKGEWIELFNAGDHAANINGWIIIDEGSDHHVIDNGGQLSIPARGYLVLGKNAVQAENGGVSVQYQYKSVTLGNTADKIILLNADSAEVDRVEYDGGESFPDPSGASMELNDPALDNNIGANWHTASTPFGAGDMGTPGAPNSTPLMVTTAELPPCFVGISYRATLSAQGGTTPYQWSLSSGALPGGLSFEETGVISGTAAAADTVTLKVKVQDAGGKEATKELSLKVTVRDTRRGDVNGDATINVIDVLTTVNHILGLQVLEGVELDCADCNADLTVNVLDALGIVNVILGIAECAPA